MKPKYLRRSRAEREAKRQKERPAALTLESPDGFPQLFCEGKPIRGAYRVDMPVEVKIELLHPESIRHRWGMR